MTASTWVPGFAQVARSYVPRGGGFVLDVDIVTSGDQSISRDAGGGLLLVRGADRLVNRIVRAVVTIRGTFWADPGWGAAIIPGYEGGMAMQLLEVAMAEVQRYSLTIPLSPQDRISDVKVTVETLASDGRDALIDMILYDGNGTAYPSSVVIPLLS